VVGKIRSVSLFLRRNLLRILSNLLKSLGIDSKRFGPPSGYYWSLEEFYQSGIDSSKVIFKNQIDALTIGKPYNFEYLRGKPETQEHAFESSELRLNKLENGRFHLNPHAVISSNDKLIFSESCCYGMNPEEHWIFNQIRLSKCTKLQGQALMLGGRANYWHLLSEELPALYRLQKNGITINDFQHLIIHQSRYEFQDQIYDLFDIPKSKFIELSRYPHLQADQLFCFSPIYQPDIEALTWVRDRMLSFVKNKALSDRRIFIDRESSSSKRIVNQKELMEILIKYDFEIFKPEDHSVLEQISTFRNSDFIIGAHGAALANLMFCKPQTNVIEIRSRFHTGSFSAPYVYMWYKELNNLRYSVMPSDIKESKSLRGRSQMDSDFIIDVQQLERLIQFHISSE
jgi:capsular polysaccharide biosynthesis protein